MGNRVANFGWVVIATVRVYGCKVSTAGRVAEARAQVNARCCSCGVSNALLCFLVRHANLRFAYGSEVCVSCVGGECVLEGVERVDGGGL